MKKALPIWAALCLAFVWIMSAGSSGSYAKADASAGELEAVEPLNGICKAPGESEMPGAFVRYSLPQFAQKDSTAQAINRYYQQMAAALAQLLPDSADADGELSVSFETSFLSERYLSLTLNLASAGANGDSVRLRADTFALDGIYAGRRLTLSQLLGMEKAEGEPDVAAQLAQRVVWQWISQELSSSDHDYLDGLTEAELAEAFHPETDFYLDADGNVVFFIQAGEIASEVAGILRYPFAIPELLDSVGQ